MAQASFWARRVHSLSGVVPIGAFLVEHLYSNSFSTQGPAAYNGYVEKLQSLPYVLFMEIFLIGVPIAFHALYGAYIAYQGQLNAAAYPHARNWMYALQRATGIFLVVYIAWHVWETRLAAAFKPAVKEDFFGHMQALFQDPAYVAFYVAGVACASFHFANGLWTFLIVWGIAAGPRGQRLATYPCAALGVALFAMGVNSINGFLSLPPGAEFALAG
jgi:succinate dehydrogenase / fumarate reductase cytochrome b subunit